MSEPNQPEEKKPAITMHYVSVVTCERPTDVETRITRHEFELLCQGDTNKEETKRDNAKNLCIAAVISLAGILASADWSTGFRQRPWPFYLFVIVFFVAVAWFGNEWRTFGQGVKQKRSDSIHARTMADIKWRLQAAANAAASTTAVTTAQNELNATPTNNVNEPHDAPKSV